MEGIGKHIAGVFTAVAVGAALIPVALWGCWELIDYFFIEDVLRCQEQASTGIELVIRNNEVDTIYIYKCPDQ